MRIEIIAKNYKVQDRLKDVIEKKLGKFTRYFEEDALAKVVVKQLNTDKYAMEVTINFDGGKIIRGEVITDNMYDNIDIVLPKLERQIRKHRTKLGKKIKESGFDQAFLYDEPVDKPLEVARIKPTDLKKLSVSDAISEMELLDHDFYAFVNEDNGMVNIVYKRAVGGVGVLDLIY